MHDPLYDDVDCYVCLVCKKEFFSLAVAELHEEESKHEIVPAGGEE